MTRAADPNFSRPLSGRPIGDPTIPIDEITLLEWHGFFYQRMMIRPFMPGTLPSKQNYNADEH